MLDAESIELSEQVLLLSKQRSIYLDFSCGLRLRSQTFRNSYQDRLQKGSLPLELSLDAP
jgi:hypothetical protein